MIQIYFVYKGGMKVVKRYFVRTRDLRKGMRIDQEVENSRGHSLIVRGSYLDEYQIEALKKLNINGVYIKEGEEDDNPSSVAEPTSAIAKNNISKYREADPAKVSLSVSVKKRISEGIQHLYSDTSNPHFIQTTTTITSDLMRAIDDNAAVAVDISALKTSDEYTFKHSVDVATMSMIVAKNMQMSQQDVYNIGIAGLLHDMGKSKIPLNILNKPGKLTDEEFSIIKEHSLLGYRIIKEKNEFNDSICFAVLQHHEKMNGSGYPMGVSSDKIVPYAKILSVVDVYDALVTERPYKKAFSQRTAVEMVMSMSEELDITAMRSFLSSVILYPVDSTVELSNGEKARVVKNSALSVLRPTVVGLQSGTVYNLAEDLSCANIVIL